MPGDSWVECDWFIEYCDNVRKLLGQAGCEEAQECTRAYFERLLERRARAIAYSQVTHPRIEFLGMVHEDLVTYADSEEAKLRVRECNERAWKIVRRLGEASCGLFIEEQGKEDAFTLTTLAQRIQAGSLKFYGKKIPLAVIEAGIPRDWRLSSRAIVRGSPKVYAGEEWPIAAEYAMRRLLEKERRRFSEAHVVLGQFATLIYNFKRLRSGLILIRAFERMQADGIATLALIAQGAFHAVEMKELKPIFGFELTLHNLAGHAAADIF